MQNLVFCMISRDSGMQCSGFVIPLMCKILNRVWLRNYIGLHSSVTTPQKSLLSQLIGLGLGHTRFDTISQHRKPPHTSHAPSICFHTSLEAKKSTWIDILLLVAGHTFSRHLNKAPYSVFFVCKKITIQSPNQLHSFTDARRKWLPSCFRQAGSLREILLKKDPDRRFAIVRAHTS